MSARPFSPGVPRGALIGAGMLVAFTIALAGISRTTGFAHQPAPVAQVAMARDLRFEDRDNGAVAVFDAANGRLVDMVAPGTNGFLRATVRGLATQRRREDGTPATPFHLVAWSDGRLTLTDPVSGRHVDLEAFGETNEGAFAHLLMTQETAP